MVFYGWVGDGMMHYTNEVFFFWNNTSEVVIPLIVCCVCCDAIFSNESTANSSFMTLSI